MNTIVEKLKQVRIDRKIALDAVESAAKKEIARLEAELDKPKLRPVHGSKLKVRFGHESRIALYDTNGTLRGFDIVRKTFWEAATDKNYITLDEPTIFDDLKAMSEPLTEFEVFAGNKTQGFEAIIQNKSSAFLSIADSGKWCFSLKNLVDIHSKLGRLIVTVKKEQND